MNPNLQELHELVSFLRAIGVVRYKTPTIELELGEVPQQAIIEPALDKPLEVKESRKGKDGLTASEQVEMYGRILDAGE